MHEEHLKIILQVLMEHHLYAKFSKCDFFKDKIQYLGHVITKDGISVDPDKIKAINEWSVPKDVTDVLHGDYGVLSRIYRGIFKDRESHNFSTEEREAI